MNCSDLRSNLSLYSDDFMGEAESAMLSGHLEICPLCRQKYTEYQEMRSTLRQIRRPEIPLALRNKLKESVRVELRTQKLSWLPISSGIHEWLQMRVMPYGVGVFASVVVGVTFLTMMFSGMLKPGKLPVSMGDRDSSVMLASNSNPFRKQDEAEISPSEYAKTRLGLANESPSINPQGALIALTRSLVRGGMKDDEVVVVADVFDNGLAQIAEVVEPSRDRRAVGQLEKALESDAAYAPFVPSTMEDRPESVRVVLKFQSVDVSTRSKSNKHRL